MRSQAGVAATMLAGTALLLAGCGDASAPDGRGGLYRLATVNGLSLPYVPPPGVLTPFFTLYGGELLLRGDGTFTLMLDGLLVLLDGSYATAGGELTLKPTAIDPPGATVTAVIGGDSVEFAFSQPGVDLVFRRSPIPKTPVRDAAYVLSSVNGRGEPLITTDTVLNGTRYVSRVLFDSVTFSDGVFFRRHRAETTVAYGASGPSVVSESEGWPWGTYDGTTGSLVLRWYFGAGVSQPRPDSLAIGTGTLTRVIRLRGRTIEERYSVRR